MMDTDTLGAAILDRLRTVIDPETGANVVRMRLVEEICIGETGIVNYKIRPSSELCPLALPLALAIRHAVNQVPGVNEQNIEIVGYMHAKELTQLLKELERDYLNKVHPGGS